MGKFNPQIHHRRSIRLKGWDYTNPGAYFVTICVAKRECLLGQIVDQTICLSAYGRLVQATWEELPIRYSHVRLDAFCIMPNHVHGIVVLTGGEGGSGQAGCTGLAGAQPAQDHSPVETQTRPYDSGHGLPEIVRAFKSYSALRINRERNMVGVPFWQRNYYEHIIRNETEWQTLSEYIRANPMRWQDDSLHPEASEKPNNQG